MTIHPFFAPSVHLSLLSKVHQNGEAGKVDIRIQFFQMQIRCDVSLGGMLIDRTYRSIGFRLPYPCIQKIIFDKVSLLCNTTHILSIYIIAYAMTSYNKIAAKSNCNCNMSHLGNCQNHLGDACHTSRTWQIIRTCRVCIRVLGYLWWL